MASRSRQNVVVSAATRTTSERESLELPSRAWAAWKRQMATAIPMMITARTVRPAMATRRVAAPRR